MEVLDQSQVATLLRISERTLEDWRYRGEGPPFVKLGRRRVGYLRQDVERWLAEHRRPQPDHHDGDAS